MAHPRSARLTLGARLTAVALIVTIAGAIVALLAGPGYRLGLWPLGAGIQTVRWAVTVVLAAAALGLLGALLSIGGARRDVLVGLAALVAGVAVATPALLLWRSLDTLPHIHDVTTDTDNPPRFIEVLPLRKAAHNRVDYPAATAALQKRGYPDIAPVFLPIDVAPCFARAEAAARAMGWDIVAASPRTLQIEATDTSLLFGFKDDVVVRVAPDAQGCRVDVRSLSRVGGFDFGANAKRVRAYLARLRAG